MSNFFSATCLLESIQPYRFLSDFFFLLEIVLPSRVPYKLSLLTDRQHTTYTIRCDVLCYIKYDFFFFKAEFFLNTPRFIFSWFSPRCFSFFAKRCFVRDRRSRITDERDSFALRARVENKTTYWKTWNLQYKTHSTRDVRMDYIRNRLQLNNQFHRKWYPWWLRVQRIKKQKTNETKILRYLIEIN